MLRHICSRHVIPEGLSALRTLSTVSAAKPTNNRSQLVVALGKYAQRTQVLTASSIRTCFAAPPAATTTTTTTTVRHLHHPTTRNQIWRPFSSSGDSSKKSGGTEDAAAGTKDNDPNNNNNKDDDGSDETQIVLTPGQKVVAYSRLSMWAAILAFASVCAYYIGRELFPT